MPVPITQLEFLPYTSASAVTHRVYLRQNWQDDWTYAPWLFCDQATWACAPTIPTAQLDWDVGYIIQQGMQQAAWYDVLDVGRWFVKIESGCHTAFGTPLKVGIDPDAVAKLRWDGILEVSQEMLDGIFAPGGAGDGAKTGHQKLTAYGLAQMLARTPMDGHWWAETASPASTHFSEHPAIFNRADPQGRIAGNRSSHSYLFSDKVLLDDVFWCSRDMVHYLCQNHTPRDTSSPFSFVFFETVRPGTETIIPNWDRPLLKTQGKNVWQVLNEILHRGRLLSFYLEVTAGLVGDIVELVPVSLSESDITTDEGTLLANPRQFSVRHHSDRACRAAFREDTLQAVDQFILRGARRASIVSVGYQDAPGSTGATLEKGWTSTQETAYEAGGSGDAGYAAASNEEKQRRNAQARALDAVFPVFRRFQIPDAWSVLGGKVKDGRGGTAEQAAFIKDIDREVGIIVNPRELRVLPTLPLKDGYDYTAIASLTLVLPPTRVSLGPHENLPPLVFFKIPDQTTRWIEASQIGRLGKEETSYKQNHKFSVRVEVPARDKAVLLEITGQPQHVIAFTDFNKLAVDPYCGEWDWQTAVFTLALEDDRHCEGKWPADAGLIAHEGELRRVVIDVGDEYRTDFIAAHTVLGVNKNDGTLTECTVGGFCQDDRKKLEAKAKLAHTYYSQGRNSLSLTCDRPTNALLLGDYIATTSANGQDTVGSIVTQLTLRIPASHDEPPTFSIETGHAELDFLEHILERDRMF